MHVAVKGGARAGALLLVVAVVGAIGLHRARGPSELPPWFGDRYRAPARIAGTVFGATGPMTVRMVVDAPDPFVWAGAEVTTSATGEFDFGPMRAGRYVLVASGNGWLSRTVLVDTLRGVGDRTELFAYEWKTVEAKLDRDAHGNLYSSDWSAARRLSTQRERDPDPVLDVPPPEVRGTVLHADGTPAAFVGVVPVARPLADHSRSFDEPVVATTDATGHFHVAVYDVLWGFRILMGPRTHEVMIPYDAGESHQPIMVSLPAIGAEQHGVFNPDRREVGDPEGAWIRGRVVRAGRPVPDAAVSFSTGGNVSVIDGTRTRRDGSFALYISAREVDRCGPVALHASDGLKQLDGLAVVDAVPGGAVDGVTIEVGAGIRVTGTVVDESGRPVQGAQVSEAWWYHQSASTDRDGHFELTLPTQGRHRLRAFSPNAELPPPEGRLPPAVDVAVPDGQRDSVRVVVQRGVEVSRERAQSGWAYDGYIDLGAEIRGENTVVAVGDELEAAGLRVGDVIVGTDPAMPHDAWWHAEMIRQGESTTLTVWRADKEIEIHADAPYFGADKPRSRACH